MMSRNPIKQTRDYLVDTKLMENGASEERIERINKRRELREKAYTLAGYTLFALAGLGVGALAADRIGLPILQYVVGYESKNTEEVRTLPTSELWKGTQGE